MNRDLAILARRTVAGVYDPEGMEVAIVRVHHATDSAVVEDNYGDRSTYSLEELTASRELLHLRERER